MMFNSTQATQKCAPAEHRGIMGIKCAHGTLSLASDPHAVCFQSSLGKPELMSPRPRFTALSTKQAR